jgi:ankyrin repeat protein
MDGTLVRLNEPTTDVCPQFSTTPLKCACGYGYVAIGELLCLNGASVNGRSMQTKYNKNETTFASIDRLTFIFLCSSSALFCAARTRKRQLVELLAVLGADVDAAFHVGYGDELTPLAAVAHRRTLSRLLVHLNAELPAEPESLFCSWADKEMVSRFVNLCNEQSKRSVSIGLLY